MSQDVERGVVLSDYSTDEFDELSIRKGQIVKILKIQDELELWSYLDWNGTKGFFPKNYIQVLPKCKVIADYIDIQPDEIEVRVGDIVQIIKQEEFRWLVSKNQAKGWIPSIFVEEIKATNLSRYNTLDAVKSGAMLVDVRKNRARRDKNLPVRHKSIDIIAPLSEFKSNIKLEEPIKLQSAKSMDTIYTKEIGSQDVYENVEITPQEPPWKKALKEKKRLKELEKTSQEEVKSEVDAKPIPRQRFIQKTGENNKNDVATASTNFIKTGEVLKDAKKSNIVLNDSAKKAGGHRESWLIGKPLEPTITKLVEVAKTQAAPNQIANNPNKSIETLNDASKSSIVLNDLVTKTGNNKENWRIGKALEPTKLVEVVKTQAAPNQIANNPNKSIETLNDASKSSIVLNDLVTKTGSNKESWRLGKPLEPTKLVEVAKTQAAPNQIANNPNKSTEILKDSTKQQPPIEATKMGINWRVGKPLEPKLEDEKALKTKRLSFMRHNNKDINNSTEDSRLDAINNKTIEDVKIVPILEQAGAGDDKYSALLNKIKKLEDIVARHETTLSILVNEIKLLKNNK